jgi:hypothetical protein
MRQLCERRCAAFFYVVGKFTEPGTEHEADCRNPVESGGLRSRFERMSKRIDALFFCVRGGGSSP